MEKKRQRVNSTPSPATADLQAEQDQEKSSVPVTASGRGQHRNKGGAPRGNRNAAKIGEDLKYQSYMSKATRSLFEEFFKLRYGRAARNEAELIHLARQIGEAAIMAEMARTFEYHRPSKPTDSGGEVF